MAGSFDRSGLVGLKSGNGKGPCAFFCASAPSHTDTALFWNASPRTGGPELHAALPRTTKRTTRTRPGSTPAPLPMTTPHPPSRDAMLAPAGGGPQGVVTVSSTDTARRRRAPAPSLFLPLAQGL